MILTRKQEIISVASKLFKEKGYQAVSMRDIAKSLGIKASSLYNHIDGKQEILSTLILEVANEFTNGMQTVVAEKVNPIKKIEMLIERHIDISINYAEGLAALNNDWMHLDEKQRAAYVKLRDAYEANFRKIIQQGIAEGGIKSLDPEVVLFSILSTLRTLYLWFQKREKLDVLTLKKEMVTVMLEGVKA